MDLTVFFERENENIKEINQRVQTKEVIKYSYKLRDYQYENLK